MQLGFRADALVICALLLCAIPLGLSAYILWSLLAFAVAWSWWTKRPSFSLLVLFTALLCGPHASFHLGELPITLAKVAFLNLVASWWAWGQIRRFDIGLIAGFGLFLLTMFISGNGPEFTWTRWEPIVSMIGMGCLIQTVGLNLHPNHLKDFMRHAGALLVILLILYLPEGLEGAWAASTKGGWTYRAFGPMRWPNSWAMVLVVWLPPLLAHQLERPEKHHALTAALLFALTPLVVLQTMSRSAALVLFAVVVIMGIVHFRSWKTLWPAPLLFLGLSWFLLNWDGVGARLASLANRAREIELGHWSLNTRTRVAQHAMDSITNAPWMGVGSGYALPTIERLSDHQLHVKPHNTYLTVLMEQGLIGGLGLIILAASWLLSWIRDLPEKHKERLSWLGTWLPSLLAVGCFGLTADVLTFPLFWLLIALALAASKAPQD